MALTGDAKTAYMRDYMRKRRAEQATGKPKDKPKSEPQQHKQQAAHAAEIARLKAEVARLKAALAAKPAARNEPEGQLTRSTRRESPFSEVGKLRAEIGKLKSDIFKLKAMLQEEPDAAKLRKKVIDQQVEMAGLRQALRRAAKQRDEYQARTQPKYRKATKHATPENYRLLIKALHSDRLKQCSTAELAAAERVAVALRPLFIEADTH